MKVQTEGRFKIVAVEKESDWQTAVEEALALSDGHFVLLDVEGVDLTTSRVVSFFNLKYYVGEKKGRIALVNPTEKTSEVLEATGMSNDAVFPVFGSLQNSIAAFEAFEFLRPCGA